MKWNPKKALPVLLAVMLTMSFLLAGCGSSNEDDDIAVPDDVSLMDTPDYTKSNDPKLASKAEALNKDPENFYGTWISTSADAENLYGTLEITIKEDGTFNADITDMKMSGSWKKIDGGIAFSNDLISGEIYYGPTCVMTFREYTEDGEDDETIEVVLKKKD